MPKTTMDYVNATDHDLVQIVQSGHDEHDLAFAQLFDRYSVDLKRASDYYYHKAPRVGYDEWYSKTLEHFWEAVRKFDVNNATGTPFDQYFRFKLAKRAFDVIRSRMYARQRDEAGKMVAKAEMAATLSLDEAVNRGGAKHNGAASQVARHETIEDERQSHEVAQRMTNTPLFQYIRKQSIDHAEFLRLQLCGYTSVEIGHQMGRIGSDAGLKNWGKRMRQRIQQITVDFYRHGQMLDEIRMYLTDSTLPCNTILVS